jgi:hypothetical protein
LSCRAEREAGFGEATLDEVGASLDAAQAAADGLDEMVTVTEDDVGGSAAPEQRPDALDRVEVRRIARQLDDGEPVMFCRVLT